MSSKIFVQAGNEYPLMYKSIQPDPLPYLIPQYVRVGTVVIESVTDDGISTMAVLNPESAYYNHLKPMVDAGLSYCSMNMIARPVRAKNDATFEVRQEIESFTLLFFPAKPKQEK